ncbi:bifunctional oligoribonuclease/PAP phosphatase NrnA [Radiobacillus kanasensis]|uniref:DHH family phosphoesterase n=1 Tax=Radiobacillus kanasensis TaxID=2844358 RepID=UPI001E441D95|nr:bifunctional oligoribonuclease/PAP phosphatase NrnA [Radiobacillus kanasensis]UFT98021.1 bifunctional oligoribonuclease/PAP phosphatase NrnA [Radiobacillus kanasensis]
MITSILEKIKQYETIIIHRHVRPDPDAFGSQKGLAEIIKGSFPKKKVYLVGDEDPSLSFLAEMDDIEDEVYRDALVIVCDTANQARVSDQRYGKGKEIIKIDHHPNVDPYGDIIWVDTNASSTSELIYELYLVGKEKGFVCTAEAARLLYGGIVGDTGRFLFPSTTSKTFQYAADLVTYDFDRSTLYDGIYTTAQHVAKFKGYILQHIEVSEAGVCAIRIDKDTLEKFGISAMETSQLVGILGDVEGVLSWAFFVEEDELIRVRLRSKGPVINEIAAKYDGGGHPLASGASIYKWEDMDRVLADLEEACKAYQK